jgi:hypothetical protein
MATNESGQRIRVGFNFERAKGKRQRANSPVKKRLDKVCAQWRESYLLLEGTLDGRQRGQLEH